MRELKQKYSGHPNKLRTVLKTTILKVKEHIKINNSNETKEAMDQ